MHKPNCGTGELKSHDLQHNSTHVFCMQQGCKKRQLSPSQLTLHDGQAMALCISLSALKNPSSHSFQNDAPTCFTRLRSVAEEYGLTNQLGEVLEQLQSELAEQCRGAGSSDDGLDLAGWPLDEPT